MIGIRNITCLLLLGLTSFCFLSQAEPPGKDYVPGEILIKFHQGTPSSTYLKNQSGKSLLPLSVRKIAEKHGFHELKWLGTQTPQKNLDLSQGLALLRMNVETDISAVIQQLILIQEVEFAEPNYIGSLTAVPNDSLYPINQQELYRDVIGLEEAWDVTTGSRDIIVAVLDSGIDSTHPEFSDGRILAGYNFVNSSTDTQDPIGHGTRVAGIIGAAR